MSGMVFIDSNVPMYLIGSPHPLKERCLVVLQDLINARRRLVTSAEVLQEICHRYYAINRLEFIQIAFDTVYGLVDQIFPVTKDDAEAGKTLMLGYKGLSARDALHAALTRQLGIEDIFSFDSDFDRFSWLRRIS